MKKRSIVWQGCYSSSTEYVEVNEGESIIVRGNITGVEETIPYSLSYILHTNLNWEVQSVSVIVKSLTSLELFFEKKKDGWYNKEGIIQPALKDCTDIDISLTPFTNTLPVRRLQLAVGETQEITVLYISMPDGESYAMKQRYTNIDNCFYKYENADGHYSTVLELDEQKMVVYYPGRWQRVYP